MAFLDLTSTAPDPIPSKPIEFQGRIVQSKRCKITTKGLTARRPLSSITGVTIHQMATMIGKPRNGSKYERAHNIPAHMSAFRDGTNVLAFPVEFYMYHGNAFNEHDIGIEFEGHYAGVADDPTTPRREDLATTWRKEEPTPLTEDIVLSFRAALHQLVDHARQKGCPIKYVHAHRQSNGDKPSDPGELIWRRVVLEYGVPVLELEPQCSLVLRDGRPIPLEWDPEHGVGAYRDPA